MLITRFLRIICGYVDFKADGGNTEKFLNLSARAGITLWDIHRSGTALCAKTILSNFKKLSEPAKKAGVRLEVIGKKGLPLIFKRHRGRWGFICGAALFVGIMFYFSGYIWSIEITGNKIVETREIQYTLSELGLCPGVRLGSLDTNEVEQQALLKLPELSWMHINLDGTTAKVEVGERSERPELVADDRPCNIKASQTGQIISINVYQGKAVLKKNDTVQQGELLVSGVVEEPKTLVTRYLHARAKVIARTKHELTVDVPYNTTKMVDTGKVAKRYTLNFLNVQIPFYRSEPQGNYRRMVYKSPLTIFGFELPISLKTEVFCEYVTSPCVLTKKQAEQKAKELIAQKEKTELSSVKVKSKKYTIKENAKRSLTITGNYDCEEDIAVQQEIIFGSENGTEQKKQ
jgi:similar to stage IV sporulation protein